MNMRVSILQTDIVWENKQANLCLLRQKLEMLKGQTDIIILPETFSTGFSMETDLLAEPNNGMTISTLQSWSSEFNMALIGSHIACEYLQNQTGNVRSQYYNRAFFITPDGDTYYYDKHHLFRMGNETKYFSPGKNRPIIHYHGWNILLLICYDLRFPVWSRNRNNEYDMVVYVANWPATRRRVWDVMLQARAMENSSYLCGVNRIGMDGNNLFYNGGSAIYSPKGELLANVADNVDGVATATLSLNELKSFREKFPVWKDADSFTLL